MVRARLLEALRGTLPLVIRREGECEEAVREALQRTRNAYRERFEREVSDTLADPAFSRPVAERIAKAELNSFRRELERELAALVGRYRRRLREAIGRLMEEH